MKTDENNFPILADLEIISSDDTDSLPNFTKDRVGQTIQVNFRQEDEINLADIVNNVHVEFTGNQHGGRFFGKFHK